MIEHSGNISLFQIILLEVMRPKILNISHIVQFYGLTGKRDMVERLSKTFYWKQLAS